MIHLPSADHLVDVKPIAEEIGVECIVTRCEVAEHLFEDLAEHMASVFGGPRPMMETAGAVPEMIGDFYEAAAAFYRSRVWISTPPDRVVEIRCPELLRGIWYAVIMGQMGEELGIMFFDDLKTLKRVMQSDPMDPGAGAAELKGLALSLNEQQLMAPADVDAAEQFGWPVPAPEAWPMAYQVSGGGMQPVDDKQLQFVTAAARGVIAQLGSSKPSLETAVDLHEKTIQVHTKQA